MLGGTGESNGDLGGHYLLAWGTLLYQQGSTIKCLMVPPYAGEFLFIIF